ncbi:DNA-directed RNA polymerase specialized sigma24 family protein [Pedobacter africanus]|uniref:DNA-directed RNA polymerase specialized sigma24 family protein n=1 Tax=Pedobacter africanus TaxID=151894 RepID=A0ACC6L278_9SPHI|nr:hypothetical protein [Pedobacter africanus]MDR6785520.1 DNA-directed RNA polymerase specialized sigma24 family protein [Pedobacter africanus]
MKKGTDLKEQWRSFINYGGMPAFHELYSHYHDYFFYLGFKKGIVSENIKDNINDLFLYIYEHRLALKEVKDHHNYLVTSFLRKLFKKHHFSADDSLEMEDLDESHSFLRVENKFIIDDNNETAAQILKQYIGKLTNSQAGMVYEKFYLGLSYEEMARNNGISVKTAYNTIYNAVNQLRKLMNENTTIAIIVAISSLFIFIFFFLMNP